MSPPVRQKIDSDRLKDAVFLTLFYDTDEEVIEQQLEHPHLTSWCYIYCRSNVTVTIQNGFV